MNRVALFENMQKATDEPSLASPRPRTPLAAICNHVNKIVTPMADGLQKGTPESSKPQQQQQAFFPTGSGVIHQQAVKLNNEQRVLVKVATSSQDTVSVSTFDPATAATNTIEVNVPENADSGSFVPDLENLHKSPGGTLSMAAMAAPAAAPTCDANSPEVLVASTSHLTPSAPAAVGSLSPLQTPVAPVGWHKPICGVVSNLAATIEADEALASPPAPPPPTPVQPAGDKSLTTSLGDALVMAAASAVASAVDPTSPLPDVKADLSGLSFVATDKAEEDQEDGDDDMGGAAPEDFGIIFDPQGSAPPAATVTRAPPVAPVGPPASVTTTASTMTLEVTTTNTALQTSEPVLSEGEVDALVEAAVAKAVAEAEETATVRREAAVEEALAKANEQGEMLRKALEQQVREQAEMVSSLEDTEQGNAEAHKKEILELKKTIREVCASAAIHTCVSACLPVTMVIDLLCHNPIPHISSSPH